MHQDGSSSVNDLFPSPHTHSHPHSHSHSHHNRNVTNDTQSSEIAHHEGNRLNSNSNHVHEQ